MKEPHQEQAPAVVEAAGSFLPPTPPRDPPSHVVVEKIFALLILLVNLDVHQIVGYHYFDHHQPSRGSSVRLL